MPDVTVPDDMQYVLPENCTLILTAPELRDWADAIVARVRSQEASAEATATIAALREERERIHQSYMDLLAEKQALEDELATLKAAPPAPPVVEPVPEQPEAQTIPVYIVDNSNENDAKYDRLRSYLDEYQRNGIRRVIMYVSPHMMMTLAWLNEFANRGLQWECDNVWTLWTKHRDKFERYVTAAVKWGVKAWRFDDAHNQQPEQIAPIIQIIRTIETEQNVPPAPVWGTFAATPNRDHGDGTFTPIDFAAYRALGIQRSFQLYVNLQGKPGKGETIESKAAADLKFWFDLNLPVDGVDLPACRGDYLPTPEIFNMVLDVCREHGIAHYTVYSPVEEPMSDKGLLLWRDSPELFKAVGKVASVKAE